MHASLSGHIPDDPTKISTILFIDIIVNWLKRYRSKISTKEYYSLKHSVRIQIIFRNARNER